MGERTTRISVGIEHSPYNRMMIRDMALVFLAIVTVVGVVVLIALGRTIPGELWGMAATLTGGIVGSMGRYNGFDRALKPTDPLTKSEGD